MLGGMEIALVILVVVLAAVVAVLAVRRPATAPAPVAPTAPALDPETLLAPIREQLRAVEGRVQQAQVQAAEQFASVGGALQGITRQNAALHEQGARLDQATTRISTALQGTGVAGDWGEMQLRRTVELAGLTEHVSFVEQETIRTAEGSGRPDLVVRLPQRRTVIVDAKAPLVDFDGTGDAASQAVALKKHVADLAGRNYSAYSDGALDFVVLFVPTEGILATALGHDPSLTEYAISKKVLVATPMTLLAMLRAVQYGWLQVASAENARQIAVDAATLHDRLATFVDHFNRIGNGLRTATNAYNDAAGSLQRTVRPQAVRMRDHGLAVTKEIDEVGELELETRSVDWR